MLKFSALLLVLIVTACSPSAGDVLPTEAELARIDLETDDVHVNIQKPAGWSAYVESQHVILSEHEQAMAEDGSLNGLVINIWTPTLEDFNVTHRADQNAAWEILQEVVHAPHLVGDSAHSTPTAFKWMNHDAAYYTLNNGDGHGAFVLVVMLPESDRLVAMRASAPMPEIHRIRELLPTLFEGLVINDVEFDSRAIHESLPLPLEFPDYGEAPPNLVTE